MTQRFYATVALFHADLLQLRRFATTRTLAKLFIAIISLGLVTAVGAGIYTLSLGFFEIIAPQAPYGLLTSLYLLHAELIVSLLLVAVSAVVSSMSTLLSNRIQLSTLLTYPGQSDAVSLWLVLKPFFSTAGLLLLLWMPPIVAFTQIFSPASFWLIVSAAVITAITISLVLQSIGMLAAIFLAPKIQGNTMLAALSTAVGLIFLLVATTRLILPRSLGSLLRIDIEQFAQVYASLPLNASWLPTTPIMTFLESAAPLPLAGLLVTCALLAGGTMIVIRHSIQTRIQQLLSQPHRNRPWSPPHAWWQRAPLFLKELLGLFRVSSERNAYLFFFGLLAALFYFLRRALLLNPGLQSDIQQLLQFGFAAMLFIVTALLLRVSFPLLSRESGSHWYPLREPVPLSEWIKSKGLLGIGIGLDALCVALLGWWIVPLTADLRQPLLIMTVIGITLLSLLITGLGLLHRDWESETNPAEASTSPLGILALTLSLLVVLGSSLALFSF